jgi:bacterioferritin
MTNEKICERLNAILANELTGTLMYLHYSFYIYGHARIPIVGWLREQASEGVTHATLVGDKIITHGGDPLTEPGLGKFPFDMYAALLTEIEDTNLSLRVFLEAMITEESGHIEEIEKMLRPDVVH